MRYEMKPCLRDAVWLLDRFIAESVYDTTTCVESVTKVLTNRDFLSIIAYDGDTPAGLLVAGVYRHPLFEVLLASDLVNYVTPEYRGGLISRRFVRMFEDWAKSKSAKYVQLGQSTGTGNMERVAELFNKLGFQTTGFNTLKRI